MAEGSSVDGVEGYEGNVELDGLNVTSEIVKEEEADGRALKSFHEDSADDKPVKECQYSVQELLPRRQLYNGRKSIDRSRPQSRAESLVDVIYSSMISDMRSAACSVSPSPNRARSADISSAASSNAAFGNSGSSETPAGSSSCCSTPRVKSKKKKSKNQTINTSTGFTETIHKNGDLELMSHDDSLLSEPELDFAFNRQTMDILSAAGNLQERRIAHGGYGTPSSYASEQEMNLYFDNTPVLESQPDSFEINFFNGKKPKETGLQTIALLENKMKDEILPTNGIRTHTSSPKMQYSFTARPAFDVDLETPRKDGEMLFNSAMQQLEDVVTFSQNNITSHITDRSDDPFKKRRSSFKSELNRFSDNSFELRRRNSDSSIEINPTKKISKSEKTFRSEKRLRNMLKSASESLIDSNISDAILLNLTTPDVSKIEQDVDENLSLFDDFQQCLKTLRSPEKKISSLSYDESDHLPTDVATPLYASGYESDQSDNLPFCEDNKLSNRSIDSPFQKIRIEEEIFNEENNDNSHDTEKQQQLEIKPEVIADSKSIESQNNKELQDSISSVEKIPFATNGERVNNVLQQEYLTDQEQSNVESLRKYGNSPIYFERDTGQGLLTAREQSKESCVSDNNVEQNENNFGYQTDCNFTQFHCDEIIDPSEKPQSLFNERTLEDILKDGNQDMVYYHAHNKPALLETKVQENNDNLATLQCNTAISPDAEHNGPDFLSDNISESANTKDPKDPNSYVKYAEQMAYCDSGTESGYGTTTDSKANDKVSCDMFSLQIDQIPSNSSIKVTGRKDNEHAPECLFEQNSIDNPTKTSEKTEDCTEDSTIENMSTTSTTAFSDQTTTNADAICHENSLFNAKVSALESCLSSYEKYGDSSVLDLPTESFEPEKVEAPKELFEFEQQKRETNRASQTVLDAVKEKLNQLTSQVSYLCDKPTSFRSKELPKVKSKSQSTFENNLKFDKPIVSIGLSKYSNPRLSASSPDVDFLKPSIDNENSKQSPYTCKTTNFEKLTIAPAIVITSPECTTSSNLTFDEENASASVIVSGKCQDNYFQRENSDQHIFTTDASGSTTPLLHSLNNDLQCLNKNEINEQIYHSFRKTAASLVGNDWSHISSSLSDSSYLVKNNHSPVEIFKPEDHIADHAEPSNHRVFENQIPKPKFENELKFDEFGEPILSIDLSKYRLSTSSSHEDISKVKDSKDELNELTSKNHKLENPKELSLKPAVMNTGSTASCDQNFSCESDCDVKSDGDRNSPSPVQVSFEFKCKYKDLDEKIQRVLNATPSPPPITSSMHDKENEKDEFKFNSISASPTTKARRRVQFDESATRINKYASKKRNFDCFMTRDRKPITADLSNRRNNSSNIRSNIVSETLTGSSWSERTYNQSGRNLWPSINIENDRSGLHNNSQKADGLDAIAEILRFIKKNLNRDDFLVKKLERDIENSWNRMVNLEQDSATVDLGDEKMSNSANKSHHRSNKVRALEEVVNLLKKHVQQREVEIDGLGGQLRQSNRKIKELEMKLNEKNIDKYNITELRKDRTEIQTRLQQMESERDVLQKRINMSSKEKENTENPTRRPRKNFDFETDSHKTNKCSGIEDYQTSNRHHKSQKDLREKEDDLKCLSRSTPGKEFDQNKFDFESIKSRSLRMANDRAMQDLKFDNTIMREKLDRMQEISAENLLLQSDAADYQAELAELRAEAKDLRCKCYQLSEENRQYQAEVRDLRRFIDMLKANKSGDSRQDLLNKIEYYQMEHDRLLDEVRRLKQRLGEVSPRSPRSPRSRASSPRHQPHASYPGASSNATNPNNRYSRSLERGRSPVTDAIAASSASTHAAVRLTKDRSLSPSAALNIRDLTMDRYNQHMDGPESPRSVDSDCTELLLKPQGNDTCGGMPSSIDPLNSDDEYNLPPRGRISDSFGSPRGGVRSGSKDSLGCSPHRRSCSPTNPGGFRSVSPKMTSSQKTVNDTARDRYPTMVKKTLPRRAFAPRSPADLMLGYCIKFTRPGGRLSRGTVRYIGHLPTRGEIFIGVELDGYDGKHSGTFQGTKYFSCPTNKGIFTPFSKVIMAWE